MAEACSIVLVHIENIPIDWPVYIPSDRRMRANLIRRGEKNTLNRNRRVVCSVVVRVVYVHVRYASNSIIYPFVLHDHLLFNFIPSILQLCLYHALNHAQATPMTAISEKANTVLIDSFSRRSLAPFANRRITEP